LLFNIIIASLYYYKRLTEHKLLIKEY